jgi:hypothetical protein
MNAILKNVFAVSAGNTSNKQIIGWWERRRAFYNSVMLIAGIVTIILALLLNEIEFTDLINALPPILVFAFSANLFYTLGWVMEIVCRKFISSKEVVQKAGPILLIAGICISVLFTLAIDIALVITFFFNNQHLS